MLASRFFPRLARRVVGRSTQIPRQSKRHITFQELKEWKARIEKEFEWKKVEWRPAYGVDPFVLPDPLPDIMEPLKVTNTPGKDKPMVVLIGWLHATNKNMDKYAQLYTEAGYDVIYFVPPTGRTLLPLWKHENTERMYKYITFGKLQRLNSKKIEPVIFHVFSNNGFYNWALMMDTFQKHPHYIWLTELVGGVIIDSAPSMLTPEVLTRGILGAYVNADHQPHYYDPVWTPRLEKLWSYLLKIPKLRDALAYANKQISCLPRFGKGKIPYLFLYSSADQMVTGAETKYHIERLKSKGLQIEEYDFKTSAHVQHYKDHKEKYTKLCLDFVAKTRNISKETTRSNWW